MYGIALISWVSWFNIPVSGTILLLLLLFFFVPISNTKNVSPGNNSICSVAGLCSFMHAANHGFARKWQWIHSLVLSYVHCVYDSWCCDICLFCELDFVVDEKGAFGCIAVSDWNCDASDYAVYYIVGWLVCIRWFAWGKREETLMWTDCQPTLDSSSNYSTLVFQIVDGNSAEIAGVSLLALSGPSAFGQTPSPIPKFLLFANKPILG